jgi:hypothetical protein|tara:strand:- start:254 stop:652 length:399 start_codon:yes stop_codon:yes gene_type:complete
MPERNGQNCPTVVTYDEPLVEVSTVTNSESDEPLVQVTFSELAINGRESSFDLLDVMYLNNVDISSDGSSAICTLPCSLFTSEGDYSMMVSAPAFESKEIEFEADYEQVDYSGCQTSYSGSTELTLSLDPDY